MEAKRNLALRPISRNRIHRGDVWMRQKLRGSFTIEATYIIPLILLVLGVVFHVLFYYHDKNILLGTAHEVATYGASLESVNKEELEEYFSSRVKGKLLLFTNAEKEIDIDIEEKKVSVRCTAKKRGMSLGVECGVNRTDPEDYVRSVRKIIKIQEGIGKKN